MNSYVDRKVRPAFSYFGSKGTVCRRILELSPPHTTYVEGFAGGLSVLLNKFQSDVEVVCDINRELINFYYVLVATPEKVIEKICQIKFGKLAFYAARAANDKGDELTRAVNFLVRHRMSFSGCGRSWAEDNIAQKREKAWVSIVDDLTKVAHRLQGVNILLKSVFDVIPEYDSPETWFYLDPPYYPSTRVSPNAYTNELSQMDHLRLLRLIQGLQGHVILSGYAHHMYGKELDGWDKVEMDVPAWSSPSKDKKTRRTEILWVKPQTV